MQGECASRDDHDPAYGSPPAPGYAWRESRETAGCGLMMKPRTDAVGQI